MATGRVGETRYVRRVADQGSRGNAGRPGASLTVLSPALAKYGLNVAENGGPFVGV